MIARSLDEEGKWKYTVSATKVSDPIVCEEFELIESEPIPFVSDSEHMANIITQTADLRHSVASAGLRALLEERGYDASRSVQIACDHGDDVLLVLVLDDGTAVRLDYREHYRTRQAIRIVDWEVLTYSDREMELAKSIVIQRDESFDNDVRLYFEQNMSATDSVLPPLKWGDRIWHNFEKPPE